jgi:hypothetical protein
MKHSSQSTCIHSSTYLQSAPCINPLQKGQGRQPGTALGFSPHTHKKTDRQAVQQGQDMEARYPGDPRGRPARAHCAVAATGSIRRHRDDMINKAVVCSFDENNHEVDSLQAGDMLREKFNLHHGQYQIVKYFPEQFFIIFSDPRSKQWTLDQNSVSYRGRVFHFGDWSEESYARKTFFEFRVKVRVEGVPVHCWGEDVVARVLGKSCAIHYVQERARRREHTRSFDLWAWCSDPCEIPKEVWLTVTEPDREPPPVSTPLPLAGVNYDVPSDLKKGHVYTLRNHIEIVEDLSFLCGGGGGQQGGPPNRKPRREFEWSYGVPDSIGEKREYPSERRGRDLARCDWDQDDDDEYQHGRRHGPRRHRSLSGWVRSSSCRGGTDDCISSNGKYRTSTPFRRHEMGMSHLQHWVPKLKAKVVSFADPLITAVWPFEGAEGAADADRLLLNSGTKDGKQEAHYFYADGGSPTKQMAPKVNACAVSIADTLHTAGSPPVVVDELVAGESPIQDAGNSFDI